jgi:hypothetical protein
MNDAPSTPTTIKDIDIPFGRLVAIMLKMMLASIPAILILYALMFAFALILMAVFGGGAALFNNLGGR